MLCYYGNVKRTMMYCVLKYIDYVDYKRLKGDSNSALKSIELDDVDPELKELYFNPDCLLQLILEYVCGEAQIDIDGEYDLCNESGTLLGVKDYKANICGSAIFQHNEVYFIVLLERNPNGIIEEMSPLVGDCTASKAMKKLLFKNTASASKKSLRRLSSGRLSTTGHSGSSIQSGPKLTSRRRITSSAQM